MSYTSGMSEVLVIEAPPTFEHAGQLPGAYSGQDPRAAEFNFEHVTLDLRSCQFIKPAALLWCLVYATLVRKTGAGCEVLFPEDIEVGVYLKSTGIIGMLNEAGVVIDDRGISSFDDGRLVLPLTKLASTFDAEQAANSATDSLMESGLIAANLIPLLSDTFGELASNAAEHADSRVDSYGLIQFYQSGSVGNIFCAVADGGIGIRASLARNPEYYRDLPYDWSAIEFAIQERTSTTGSPSRGIGLATVAADMILPGRQLIIHSGIGNLYMQPGYQSVVRTKLFPGTVAIATVPC